MINKLVLGTVQLGLNYGINNQTGKPSIEKAFEILNTAYNNGITILDTAEAYGDSQEVIGKFLKKNSNKSFQIISKLAANSDIQPEEFISHIEKNCAILNVKELHGYMFHNYQSFKNKLKLYEKLLFAKEKKLIKQTGISLYTNDEIEDVLDNYKEFDFIQIPFNLFDNASKRKSLLEKAKAQNVDVHTRSVFLQGLFFKEINTLPQNLKGLKPYLEHLNAIKHKHNLTTISLALQYVLQKEYIDHVLIGVETAEQLINNINMSSENKFVPHEIIDSMDILENELLNPSNWN